MKKINYFNINNSLFSKIGFVVLSGFHIITSAQQNNSHNYDFDKSVQSCNENIGNIKNINDLFSNLELLDLKCFNKVSNFNPSLVEGYLNQENMLKIAQKAKELLENRYSTIKNSIHEISIQKQVLEQKQRDQLLKLVSILNTAYYLQSLNKNFVSNPQNEKQLKELIATITHTYAILIHYQKIYELKEEEKKSKVLSEEEKNLIKLNNEFKKLSKEVFGLIGSAKSYEESLNLIDYVTRNSRYITENNTLLIYSILPIQLALSASHDANGIYFKSEENINNFKNIIINIQNILKNDKGIINDSFYENYILEIGKFLRYKSVKDGIIETLREVIKKTTGGDLNDPKNKPSTFWLEATSALEYYEILNRDTCKTFTDANGADACKVKSKLSKSLFKNRYIYDEGSIVIYTSLNKDEANKIYFSMKQVENQYKNALQLFEPIKNDRNNRLYVYIYPTKKDYLDYKPYISDLDKEEDGGVYIDSRGAFYTFAGNQFLEDYVKHEYIHYLNSRYLYKNFANETNQLNPWKHMDWFIEGSADFFAGSKKTGIGISELRYNSFVTHKKVIPIYEILDSKYESEYSDRFYFTHFLFNKHRNIFDNFINFIKNNDTNKFINLIHELSRNEKLNLEFQNYVNNLNFKTGDIAKINNNISNFFEDITTFKESFQSIDQNSKCELLASSINSDSKKINQSARVSCSIKINLSEKNKLNKMLEIPKHSQTNCLYDKTNTMFICEGSVKLANFSDLSSSLKTKIQNLESEQFDRTFPIYNENFFFFKGDIYSSTLAKGNRDEGWYYEYVLRDQNTSFEVDPDGEYSFRNKENYEKVTKSVIINGKEVELTFFKFKDFDKRIFANKVPTRKVEQNNGSFYLISDISLYRNEGSIENTTDGFRVFDDKFRYDEVNDYDFKVIKQPIGSIVEINNRYMLRYINENPKDNDSITISVIRHNEKKGEITLPIDNSFNSDYFEDIKNEEIIIDETINYKVKDSYLDNYLYNNMNKETFMPGAKYNFTILKDLKCNISDLRDDGHFRFIKKQGCNDKTDEAIVTVTKVTNKGLFKVRTVKVIFSID